MKGFPTLISANNVSLRQDPAGNAQRGIALNNCFSNTSTYGKHVITNNTLNSVGSSSITNSNASLIFCGNNMGAGLHSPSVTCNDVRNSYNGFEFQGPNLGTLWLGNQMQKLARGMFLNSSGVIGAQGGLTLGNGNSWNGIWNSGINYGIYTSASTASLSTLWVTLITPPSYPPNCDGLPFNSSYAVQTPSLTSSSGYANYDCFTPTQIVINPTIPNAGDYVDDNSFYVAKTAMYRFLYENDSIRNSNSSLTNFYASMNGSSIDIFMRVETALSKGDMAIASSLNSIVTPTNSVETNYKAYYELYLKYASIGFVATNYSDKTNLINLAALCPGTDGACIFQARALYNSIFNDAPAFSICDVSVAKMSSTMDSEKIENIWNLLIYPNPTTNKVNVQSNTENDLLNFTINDLSGRSLFNKDLKLNKFIASIDIDLAEGVYIIMITNSKNEKFIKKLLIHK